MKTISSVKQYLKENPDVAVVEPTQEYLAKRRIKVARRAIALPHQEDVKGPYSGDNEYRVAPTTGLYTVEELNELMSRLRQGLEGKHLNVTSETDFKEDLGRLVLGILKIEDLISQLDDKGELAKTYYNNVIVRPYPNIHLAKKSFEGGYDNGIPLEHLARY